MSLKKTKSVFVILQQRHQHDLVQFNLNRKSLRRMLLISKVEKLQYAGGILEISQEIENKFKSINISLFADSKLPSNKYKIHISS